VGQLDGRSRLEVGIKRLLIAVLVRLEFPLDCHLLAELIRPLLGSFARDGRKLCDRAEELGEYEAGQNRTKVVQAVWLKGFRVVAVKEIIAAARSCGRRPSF